MASADDFSNPFFIAAENSFLNTKDADVEKTQSGRGPEQRLMLAILEDAIYCFLRFEPDAPQKDFVLFNEAEEWIFDKEENRIFSFASVCEALQIDPGYLRKGLRLRRRGKLKNRSHAKNYRSLLDVTQTVG